MADTIGIVLVMATWHGCMAPGNICNGNGHQNNSNGIAFVMINCHVAMASPHWLLPVLPWLYGFCHSGHVHGQLDIGDAMAVVMANDSYGLMAKTIRAVAMALLPSSLSWS